MSTKKLLTSKINFCRVAEDGKNKLRRIDIVSTLGDKTRDVIDSQISDLVETHYPELQKLWPDCDSITVTLTVKLTPIKNKENETRVKTGLAYSLGKVKDEMEEVVNEAQQLMEFD